MTAPPDGVQDIAAPSTELFEGRASAARRYARLIVGRPGWLALLKYEAVLAVSQWVPGAPGLALRRILYPRLLGSCGRNVVFGQNVVLRARLLDTRAKQFDIGLRQLEEEGLMQVVFPLISRREPILCVVGPLQMEVVEARLRQEYGVDCRIEPLALTSLRWLRGDPQEIADTTVPSTGVMRAADREGRTVLLFESPWHLEYCARQNPGVEFVTVG